MRVDENGTLDLEAIDEQVEHYAEADCDGVYIGGTASEIHSLSDTQFQATSRRLADIASRLRLPFQIGASHPLAPASLDRVGFAAHLKPQAIQITLPDWTVIDLNSALRFLKRCSEIAGDVPLVLYNPPHAKTVLGADAYMILADQVPALAGLKCGGGDAQWYADMGPVFERLSVFIPGHHFHSGTKQGAHGSYSNMSCLSPKAAVCWKNLPDEASADLEARIGVFMEEAVVPLLARGLPGFACDKAMAAAGGWARITPRLLWPYEGAREGDVDRIADAVKRHIPEFAQEMRAYA